MRRAAALALCAAGLAGVAAPADAAFLLPTGRLLAGPSLAGGDGVVYAEVAGVRGDAGERTVSYRLRVGDRTLRTGSFTELDAATLSGGATLAVAASSTRVGLAVQGGSGSQYGAASSLQVWGGPLDGAPAALAGCSASMLLGDPPSGRWYDGTAAVAVDGDRTAHVDCDESLVVRDAAAGGAVVARIPIRARRPVALAGAFAAVQTVGPDLRPAGVTVYDWRSGEARYSVTGDVSGLALQDDGTLVVTRIPPTSHPTTTCLGGTAEWWSAADGRGRPLPVTPCSADVAIAGGRAVLATADGARRRLELVGLDGSRTRVADLGLAGMPVGGIDFDGRGVTYALRTCSAGAVIARFEVGESAPAPGSAACPVQISPRVRLRGSRVTVNLTCPAGCAGTVSLRRGARTLASAPVPRAASGRERVSLRLGRTGRALVRRGRLRVVVAHSSRTGSARQTAAAIRLDD